MELITVSLKEIHPYINNPRKNDGAVDAVAESIRQCGYVAPIIVDEDHVILAGHTRYKALKRLGKKEAECIVKTGLTEEQKKKYRLLDNKTNEFAEWDFDLLMEELDGLDFDGFNFDFDLYAEDDAWFERDNRHDRSREDGNDEYNEFLEKFEQKKTTDDCYTPDSIYEAVADWVSNEYGLNKSDFVRPFYPGGDYQKFYYKKNAVVVDNPPFSILAEIIKFYVQNGIKFFMFAPTLTLFSSSADAVCAMCVGVAVTYENGAVVNTSFLTNLEDGCRLRSAPTLYNAVKDANDKNLKDMKRELPKYEFPDYVITSTRCSQFSRYGIDFRVGVSESAYIRALDSQKNADKAIYGYGYLISEDKKTEKEKAEREKAERKKAEKAHIERWELSERELEIVKSLGKAEH